MWLCAIDIPFKFTVFCDGPDDDVISSIPSSLHQHFGRPTNIILPHIFWIDISLVTYLTTNCKNIYTIHLVRIFMISLPFLECQSKQKQWCWYMCQWQKTVRFTENSRKQKYRAWEVYVADIFNWINDC